MKCISLILAGTLIALTQGAQAPAAEESKEAEAAPAKVEVAAEIKPAASKASLPPIVPVIFDSPRYTPWPLVPGARLFPKSFMSTRSGKFRCSRLVTPGTIAPSGVV